MRETTAPVDRPRLRDEELETVRDYLQTHIKPRAMSSESEKPLEDIPPDQLSNPYLSPRES